MAVSNINHSPVTPNLNGTTSVGQASATSSGHQVSNPKQLLASLLVEEELEQRLPIVRNRSQQPASAASSNADDGSEDWMPMIRPQQHGMPGTSSAVEGRGAKTYGKYHESDFLPPGWDRRIVTMEERTEAEETEMRVGWKFESMHKQEAVFRRNIEQTLSGAAKDDALKELADAVAHFSKQFQQEVENAKSGAGSQILPINPRHVVFVERMTTALNEHLGE
jgi:hypothetical protein